MTKHTGNSKSEKYKYVYHCARGGEVVWFAKISGFNQKVFETEREAAICVDKMLIASGKEPINILVRK